MKKNKIHLFEFLKNRGAENVQTHERGLEEILINNLKIENKWKLMLTGGKFSQAPK